MRSAHHMSSGAGGRLAACRRRHRGNADLGVPVRVRLHVPSRLGSHRARCVIELSFGPVGADRGHGSRSADQVACSSTTRTRCRRRRQRAKIVEGLKREDLFTVVSELFITDTAKYADILLPATMQAEQYDLMVTWGHLYVMLNQPAISRAGECIRISNCSGRPGQDHGLDDAYWDARPDDDVAGALRPDSRAAWNASICSKEKGYMRLNVGDPDKRVPHAEGNFKTPSGKCEFRRGAAANGNFVVRSGGRCTKECSRASRSIALPDYIPPYESPGSTR